MSMEADLITLLSTNTAIAAIVGDRISDEWPNQGDPLPRLTVTRFSGGHDHDLDGAAGSADPLVQIDAWTASSPTKWALAEAVRNCLQGFGGGGNPTPWTIGSTHFQSITFDDERDLSVPPIMGEDVSINRRMLQYRVRYVESVPTFA